MNRRLVLIGLILAVALATPASIPVLAQDESITVIFPRHEADLVGAYAARAAQFQSETGIGVTIIQGGWEQIADRILPEIATGGSAYDVVEFDNSWVAEWCGTGWLAPLDEFLPEGFTEGMIPGLVDLFTCPDDQFYGVVWNNDTRFFFYNEAMLSEAGIEAPPSTWDEMVAQTRTLQDAGVVQYGVAPFWSQEWSLINDFHFWVYTFGGEIVDEAGCFLWNEDPNTLAALEFMVQMQAEGIADPAGLTYNQAAAQNVFLNGRAAFMPQGISGLMAYADDPEQSTVPGQLAVGLVPGAEEGLSATLTLPEAYAIPANSQHKEAAWQFIEYMTSRESNIFLAKEIGVLPIWVDLYTDEELTALYPFWADFSAQLETARGLSTLTWYGSFVDIAQIEVHAALAGEKTPQEALDAMADGLAEFSCVP
ncbi:MAG: extracellular solute-binding protein [Anaerolineae bacterium]|nr:extracellular solute-binding protein [Anaerolineae bacterium]